MRDRTIASGWFQVDADGPFIFKFQDLGLPPVLAQRIVGLPGSNFDLRQRQDLFPSRDRPQPDDVLAGAAVPVPFCIEKRLAVGAKTDACGALEPARLAQSV